jgi:hypothetical protein
MGVCGSHLFAQRRIQKASSGGLGGAIHEENYEAYAYGLHVMFMGPQTQGSSDVNCQHTSSRLSYTSYNSKYGWLYRVCERSIQKPKVS